MPHECCFALSYLSETGNTICGRHPIGVILHAIDLSGLDLKTRFNAYTQSSHCLERTDSSVSYAAAVTNTRLKEEKM